MARQERERRYISQVMKEYFPDMNWQLNVELGPIPQDYVQKYGAKRAAAMFRPTRPRVDAVLWQPDAYYVVEAKLRDISKGIAELIMYRDQARISPDLPNYDGQPIKALLVIPWMIDWARQSAVASDVEIKLVNYPWIEDYIKEKQHYHTPEYRLIRDEKKKLREIFGID